MTSSAPHGSVLATQARRRRTRRRRTRRRRTRRPRAHRTTGRRRRVQRGQAGHSGYVQEQRYRAAVSFPGYTRPRDHGERLAQLDQLLAGWRDYIQKAPEDGNSLAGDDHLFPMLPPSQLAWFGIVSAVDHLDMLMALVRSGTSHPLRTTPSPAPGVLSGAHALWLLDGPDRVERQKRGLCLAHAEFFREHQAVRDIAAIQNSDLSPRLDSHEGLPRRARGVDGPGAGGRRDDRHDLERGQDPQRNRVAGHGGSPPRRARSRERRADQCRPHRLAHLFRSRPRPALAGQVSHQVRGANPWQQARHGRGAGHQQHRRPGYGRLQHQHLPDQRDQVIEKRRQPAHR